jgi:hypothetical protein
VTSLVGILPSGKKSQSGEPMWLSGKVMELENIRNQKIPVLLPSPQPFKNVSR